MKKSKLIGMLSVVLAGAMALGLASCGNGCGKGGETHDDILNGGFEQGFQGWTKSGTAFSQSGVVDTNKAGPTGAEAGAVGKYFFSGYDAANPQFTGTLQSDPFKLGGTGKIGFLMGGGMSGDKCYVEFIEQGSDAVLAKVTNEAFALGYITDQMVRVVADLSAHVGKTIYIKITDNDKGDADEYSYLNLDDFIVYKTEAEVANAEKERADKIAAIGKPEFSENASDTTIKNGNFEDGLANWLKLDGEAFGTRALCSDELFWANPGAEPTATVNRPYNKEGEYFLNTYFDESATGSVRSTKFTLAGDGIVSFLMAGAKNKGSYVALCDGESDDELVKVTFSEYFSDPNLSENMVRHYIDASEYIDRVLYVKVVDGEKSEFAGICVDDFKVSMAEADVKAQMKSDYEWSLTLGGGAVAKATQNYYSSYEKYPYELTVLRFEKKVAPQAAYEGTINLNDMLKGAKAVYDSSAAEEDFEYSVTGVIKDGAPVEVANPSEFAVTEGAYTVNYKVEYNGLSIEESFVVGVYNAHDVLNGGFELGTPAGWTTGNANWGTEPDGSLRGVIDADKWWGEELPYNQSGNYHLDGWNNGIDENATWTLKSSVFTLDGAGIITVRMGGNAAAVKVYQENGTQIGYYKQTRFRDEGFPHIASGGSWADMATYIIDLGDHVGEKLYIELCDVTVAGGWAHAFFDEVVTYYAAGTEVSELAENSDTVLDGHTTGNADEGIPPEEPQETEIAWVVAVNIYEPEEENEYQVKNGGFETGNMDGWTTDTEGFNMDTAVSAAASYWNEALPYNQSGNFHLDGWGTGLLESDTWKVKSSNFVLGGAGIITWKMGGRAAALRVYKEDGTLIAYYKQNRTVSPAEGFPHVTSESGWGDMATYVADLSDYIGETLYVELCDEEVAGDWANAFFDDVITYYADDVTVDSLLQRSDKVVDGHKDDEVPGEVEIHWREAVPEQI